MNRMNRMGYGKGRRGTDGTEAEKSSDGMNRMNRMGYGKGRRGNGRNRSRGEF